ncbi:MAG: DUF1254 domain-containing protein [Candidatus Solibacter usitatus]|nr:DUF1254 domain-containing protein [Candidatus Solibacter usitatus]
MPLWIILTSCLLLAQTPEQAREEYAFSLGVQAYIFGLPSVIMNLTRDQAPVAARNRFAHARALATHESRGVVAPNNDTLYSTAWLDLAAGALVLHLPAAKRYHTLQFLDAHTNNFYYAGTRTRRRATMRC